MSRRVTLVPGDGIGPEVIHSARKVVDALGLGIKWEEQEAGLCALNHHGVALPQKTVESIKTNQIALKGPTTTPIGTGHKSANVLLRQILDLYACVRPVKSLKGVQTRYSNVDLIVVRENSEGLYKGLEQEITPGTVISLKVVTKAASLKIAREAFKIAQLKHRKEICVVHKANILKLGDGLFLDCAMQVASQFKDVSAKDAIIDALCMKLVTNPSNFDVLLLENLYGDIVSDLCAGLVGGLGLVPGANYGESVAVFEAVHGSAPDIAGKGIANPVASILSASLMLEHMGEPQAARTIESAVNDTLEKSAVRTRDLGGSASTEEFTEAIISRI